MPKKRPASPLRIDPTRTITLRKQFMADMNARWNRLIVEAMQFVGEGDALVLSPSSNPLLNAREFQFQTDAQKLSSFNEWFKGQVDSKILDVSSSSSLEEPWTSKYVDSAYRKGVLRAYTDARPLLSGSNPSFYAGTKAQFLTQSFAAPETVSKMRLLGTRTFETLKGITAEAGSKLNVILAQGIADGKGAKELAREIRSKLIGIKKSRALTLARTEIIHAHSEGQLDAFEDLGIDELGVLSEWLTAGDNRVCPKCSGNSGRKFTVAEARGLIPLHPNCRCTWVPYVDRRSKKERKSTR